MRKILFILLILILVAVFFAHRNSDPAIILNNLIQRGGQLRSGEFTYRIYFFGCLPIGEAVFAAGKIEELQGKTVYHLTVIAKSLKFFEKMFKAKATLDSYVDLQLFAPLLFKEKMEIPGKDSVSKEVVYDQEAGFMSIAGIKRQIFPNTQDSLSLIFNLRRMNFGKTEDFEMNLNTNQKNYTVKGKAEPKELALDSKKYRLFFLRADIFRRDKNPYHRSKIKMVLVESKENIPIFVRVFAGGAVITSKLVGIK
jgi:hypothetical protein